MNRCFSRMKQKTPMRSVSIVVVGLALIMVMTTLALAGGGDIEKKKGQTLFRQTCGHCHGLNGKGDGAMAGYTNPPPANLTSQKTQSKSDDEIKDVIMNGRSGTSMVSFKDAITEGQFHDLLAYLRSLKP
ncbi:MAG: cytochrome c [Nitrospirota bacterium]